MEHGSLSWPVPVLQHPPIEFDRVRSIRSWVLPQPEFEPFHALLPRVNTKVLLDKRLEGVRAVGEECEKGWSDPVLVFAIHREMILGTCHA